MTRTLKIARMRRLGGRVARQPIPSRPKQISEAIRDYSNLFEVKNSIHRPHPKLHCVAPMPDKPPFRPRSPASPFPLTLKSNYVPPNQGKSKLIKIFFHDPNTQNRAAAAARERTQPAKKLVNCAHEPDAGRASSPLSPPSGERDRERGAFARRFMGEAYVRSGDHKQRIPGSSHFPPLNIFAAPLRWAAPHPRLTFGRSLPSWLPRINPP